MKGEEGTPETELLPPGIYPVWSPYDAYEAARVLMEALAVELSEVGRGEAAKWRPIPAQAGTQQYVLD